MIYLKKITKNCLNKTIYKEKIKKTLMNTLDDCKKYYNDYLRLKFYYLDYNDLIHLKGDEINHDNQGPYYVHYHYFDDYNNSVDIIVSFKWNINNKQIQWDLCTKNMPNIGNIYVTVGGMFDNDYLE